MEASRFGLRKALAQGKASGFLEITETGPKSPRRIRLSSALRLAICEGNSSCPENSIEGATPVAPYKPLNFDRKRLSEIDSTSGTQSESRARHDSDDSCNPIISGRPARISKKGARALLQRADLRADVRAGIALLQREGLDEREAVHLACCYSHATIQAAFLRCRQEQERANAGKRAPIKYWPGFLHRAVTNSIMRPEAKALLAPPGATQS